MDHNELYRLVLALEPEAAKNAVFKDVYNSRGNTSIRRSMLDLVRTAVKELRFRSKKPTNTNTVSTTPPPGFRSVLDLSQAEISEKTGWEAEAITLEKNTQEYINNLNKPQTGSDDWATRQQRQAAALLPYFEAALAELEKIGAKTWDEIFPDEPSSYAVEHQHDFEDGNGVVAQGGRRGLPIRSTTGLFGRPPAAPTPSTADETPTADLRTKKYMMFTGGSWSTEAGAHLSSLYDELFAAIWAGDNDKIRAMCLPPKEGEPALYKDLLQITALAQLRDLSNTWAQGACHLRGLDAVLIPGCDNRRLHHLIRGHSGEAMGDC